MLQKSKDLPHLEAAWEGGATVKTLENRPDANLSHAQRWLLTQFFTLSNHRTMGLDNVGAIPISEIEAFHRAMNLRDLIRLDEFTRWMLFLDDTLMEYYRDKDKQSKERDGR